MSYDAFLSEYRQMLESVVDAIDLAEVLEEPEMANDLRKAYDYLVRNARDASSNTDMSHVF